MDFQPGALLWSSAIVVALYVATSTIRFLLSTRRPSNFPPGPPPVLGLGNLHQVPPGQPFLKFHEWFQTYGDVVGLKMGPKNVVLLSNPAHARELFARRGTKYSDRPQSPVLTDYVVKPPDESWLSMNDNEKLKRWRTAARHVLGLEGIARAGPLQSAMGARFLYDLLQRPDSWSESVRKWALASALLSVSGQMLDDYEPGFVERYFEVQHELMQILEPNNTPPIEIFPFLAYLPAFLAKWKRRAALVREGLYDVYGTNLKVAKMSLANGYHVAYEPLLTYVLKRRETDQKLNMSDSELIFLAGGVLDAGVDTTWASTSSTILCLTAHRNVMQRAQAEIDNICGGKCPGLDDVDRLPFVKACLLEVFRWRGVAQFGLPHLVTEDDVFQGYTVPQGTTVIASAYSMHLRPEDFERPNEFDPDRYMQSPYGTRWATSQAEEGRKATYTFGIGRRVCPGEDFAKAMILMMVAKLLWAFDFEVDDEPDLSWETGYKPGLSNPPQNFHPRVKPREVRTTDEIEAEFSRSEHYLQKSGLATL